MSKRALWLIAGCCLVVLASVLGFLIIFNNRAKPRLVTVNRPQAAVAQSTPAPISVDSTNQQTVNVVSDPVTQLTGNQTSASTQQNQIDPTTFIQYEKYSGSAHSLFGDISTGTGTAVAAGSKVAIYYSGWLTNGTLFDQTKKDTNGNQQPFLFTEGAHEVIPGMEEGVAGMKVGGKRLIIVPPAVGYGSKAQGSIPANSTLVFVVTLVASQ